MDTIYTSLTKDGNYTKINCSSYQYCPIVNSLEITVNENDSKIFDKFYSERKEIFIKITNKYNEESILDCPYFISDINNFFHIILIPKLSKKNNL